MGKNIGFMLRITSIILLSFTLSSCSFFSWVWNKFEGMGSHMPVSGSAPRCTGSAFCFNKGQQPLPDQSYSEQGYPVMPPDSQHPSQYPDQTMMPQGYNATSQSQVYNMQMPNYQQDPYYQNTNPYPAISPVNNMVYGQPTQPRQPGY